MFDCAGGFSLVVASEGYSLAEVCRLLIAIASLVAEHRLSGARATVVGACRLSSCAFWALKHRLNSCGALVSLLHGMWDLPWPGIEPVSPAMAGGFFTTESPGSPCFSHAKPPCERYFVIAALENQYRCPF